MEVGQRVKHPTYGPGTVLYVMFEGKFREMYLVEFDNEHPKLHSGFVGGCKPKHGYWFRKKDLEVIQHE